MVQAFSGNYLEELVGEVPTLALAIAFVLVLMAFTLRGVSESVKTNMVLTCVELSGLVIVVLAGAYALSEHWPSRTRTRPRTLPEQFCWVEYHRSDLPGGRPDHVDAGADRGAEEHRRPARVDVVHHDPVFASLDGPRHPPTTQPGTMSPPMTGARAQLGPRCHYLRRTVSEGSSP